MDSNLSAQLMEQTHLLSYLNALLLQTDPMMMAYAPVIAGRATWQQLRPGEVLKSPREGHLQSAMVVEGVIRAYYINDNQEEATTQLLEEGGVISRTDGYYEMLAEHTFKYEALTPAVLAVWDENALEFFAQALPNWFRFSMKINSLLLLTAAREREEMFKSDATARYLKFVERYPNIINRIQMRHIADYLGIAPQSLSRIRRQLGKFS